MNNIFNKNKIINKVVLIPCGEIHPNPSQPRKIFENSELLNLAESIKSNGILQPITVRKNNSGLYELISGERRLRAAQLANLTSVPCIIIDTSEKQSAIFALLENLQRKDLNFFEEAEAISNLIVEWNITQEDAAARLGKSQSSIANKLRLLRLTDSQRHKIIEANLTERHARALLRIGDKQIRDKAIFYITKKELNVSQSEEYIETLLNEEVAKPSRTTIGIIKDVRLFINTINKAIDTMQKAGVDAKAEKKECDDCIEYIVKIPL